MKMPFGYTGATEPKSMSELLKMIQVFVNHFGDMARRTLSRHLRLRSSRCWPKGRRGIIEVEATVHYFAGFGRANVQVPPDIQVKTQRNGDELNT